MVCQIIIQIFITRTLKFVLNILFDITGSDQIVGSKIYSKNTMLKHSPLRYIVSNIFYRTRFSYPRRPVHLNEKCHRRLQVIVNLPKLLFIHEKLFPYIMGILPPFTYVLYISCRLVIEYNCLHFYYLNIIDRSINVYY